MHERILIGPISKRTIAPILRDGYLGYLLPRNNAYYIGPGIDKDELDKSYRIEFEYLKSDNQKEQANGNK